MDDKIFEDQEIINHIVEKIDILRCKKGLTVSGLALEAGLSENTLKYLYKRKNYPTIPTLVHICSALDCSLWQLFNFENSAVILTKQERKLLAEYKRLEPEHRDLILYIIEKI